MRSEPKEKKQTLRTIKLKRELHCKCNNQIWISGKWPKLWAITKYQVSPGPPIYALHRGRTGEVFFYWTLDMIYCILRSWMDWITICKFLIRRILQRWLIKYSKGCLQMQSNATVSMFSQLWMARARALCILCPAVNIWLTLIRKWPPGPGHLYSYPEYFSSLRDLYIRPFSLQALIRKRRFNKKLGTSI